VGTKRKKAGNFGRGLFAEAALLAVFTAGTCHAQPTVDLTAEVRNRERSVLFTFTQPDLASMEGCHYNLFAADEAEDLDTLPGKGLSIATFYRPFSVIGIVAGPLPRLSSAIRGSSRNTRSSARLYFRTLLSCSTPNSAMGELIWVEIKTARHGRVASVNRLIKKMKYSMRYQHPGV
jgi:hypothetical protein